MGCGCANGRSTQTTDRQLSTSSLASPERFAYLAKKREQLSRFFIKIGVVGELQEAFLGPLAKDCQGFTLSETGGEVTAIKDCIGKLLEKIVDTAGVIAAGLELIKGVV